MFFVKINVDIDPVEVAHRLCLDAKANPERKRSRWVKRLIPITLLRKGLGGGFEELAREVLKPHFHSGGPAKKVLTSLDVLCPDFGLRNANPDFPPCFSTQLGLVYGIAQNGIGIQ